MAKKKPYNVTERFQEVARRAQEVGPINTGPKKRTSDNPYTGESSDPETQRRYNQSLVSQPERRKALSDFDTRPGRVKGPNSGKDVNLPIDTAPKKYDDDFYDYEAAKKAGITKPDKTGHWPSEFKKEGHPNMVVGGYNTKTGERVPGTKQGTEKELLAGGWDAESSKRLGRIDTSPSDRKKKK